MKIHATPCVSLDKNIDQKMLVPTEFVARNNSLNAIKMIETVNSFRKYIRKKHEPRTLK